MKKHYHIDFVYTENSQQFGTQADLTELELAKLESYLEKLESIGEVTDAHVYEPTKPIHQDYTTVRKEIKAALRS